MTNSSYMTGGRQDVLLSDVEKMTGMAQNLVTALAAGGGATEGTTLSGLFGDALNATAAKYGVTLAEGQTWEQWGAMEENKTAYSNLLVLTAADEMEANKNNGTQMSTASNMILEFSSFYGFAAQNEEFSKEMDTFMAQLNDGKTVTSVATGKDWYVNLQNKAKEYGYDNYNSDTTGVNQGVADQWAFQSIMAGLGNPTEEQAANIASDLNNANLFTDGVVNNMYNDYLDAVEVMVGLGSGSDDTTFDVGSGEVAIMFVAKNGGISVSSSLPTK